MQVLSPSRVRHILNQIILVNAHTDEKMSKQWYLIFLERLAGSSNSSPNNFTSIGSGISEKSKQTNDTRISFCFRRGINYLFQNGLINLISDSGNFRNILLALCWGQTKMQAIKKKSSLLADKSSTTKIKPFRSIKVHTNSFCYRQSDSQ